MAVYEYVARDTAGREFSGEYTDINSISSLRDELSKIGCTLLKSKRKKTITVKQKKIKRAEIVTFAFKFAGMYSAGLPILSCLETMEEQTENPSFKLIIADIKHSVQTGSNLKEACGLTLDMSAKYLEKREDIKRKIISAFAYPVIVTILCFAVITFLLMFVMPTFAKLYSQAKIPLPGPTLFLIGFSNFMVYQWWVLVIVAAGITTGIKWMFKKPDVRARWDAFKLTMPMFGKLSRLLVVSHFVRTFAMLISVGVPLVDAMSLSAAVTQNQEFSKITEEMKQMIKAGFTVTRTFKHFTIFPSVIVELAASGEQSGQLSNMLNKGADLIDKDIDSVINSYLSKLEPILTMIMGTIVGLILTGAYLPMFDYMGHVGS
jgi:type IV pilus assembly protein PilC